jgi:acetyl-CoA carboxylase alpha subunit
MKEKDKNATMKIGNLRTLLAAETQSVVSFLQQKQSESSGRRFRRYRQGEYLKNLPRHWVRLVDL